MALSIGILSRSILNGTHTVPLQHSHPIQRITSASSWEIVRLSAIRPSNRDRAGEIVVIGGFFFGQLTTLLTACVCRKPKRERSGDEVRPGRRVK